MARGRTLQPVEEFSVVTMGMMKFILKDFNQPYKEADRLIRCVDQISFLAIKWMEACKTRVEL